jgi:WD40 repeat protein
MSSFRLTCSLALIVVTSARGADPVVRTDLAGDPLPPGAVARIGTVRFLARPYLEQVFFTADGATVLGRGGDNVVQFWDATIGKPLPDLSDPDIVNIRIDMSPDGKRLAIFGSDKRGKPAPDTALRVYDLATRKPLWTQVDDQLYQYQHAVRYSLDGKYIITASNAELRVWDAATGATVTRQKGSIGYSGIALSPDGRLLAGGDQGLWVWDWAARRE